MTERRPAADDAEAAVKSARSALAAALADTAPVDLSWLDPATVDARWSLSPDLVALLTRLVARVRPEHVVEFGTGFSSLVLGRACADLEPPAHLTSIDNDPKVVRAAERGLADQGIGIPASFQVAPLVLRSRRGRLVPCYHLRRELFASQQPADLVLIDGPPSALGGRQGTLYQVMEFARPGTIVLVDDADRTQEREAIERWRGDFGPRIEVEFLSGFERGLAAILVRRPVAPRPAANARAESATTVAARVARASDAAIAFAAEPPATLRHRVLYYCHDAGGFGHLRRTLAIAEELERRRPDAAQVMMVGSIEIGAYRLPSTLDTVKLPSTAHETVYAGIPTAGTSGGDAAGLQRMREAVIGATAETFAPHVFLVDNYPAGIRRELVRTLVRLRGKATAGPDVELILGLRDIGDAEADVIAAQWAHHGMFDLMERTYDRILIYGRRDVFDPVTAYRFPSAAAAKTTFCGYVKRLDPRTPAATIRDQLAVGTAPLVVITAGKGDFGGDFMRQALAALRQPDLAGVAAFVVTGPGLPAAERAEIEAAAQWPRVTLARFTDDLHSYINAADLVITMAGYNSVCEVAGLGKRAIVVPLAGHPEQRTRAERFAELGHVVALDSVSLTPERLARATRDLLLRPPPARRLDFDGLARVGDALAGALAR